jgi:Transposase DDE domain
VRASLILRKLFRACIDKMHAARVAVLLAAADALVRGGHASLTAIGRALVPTTTPKHRIKRIDRLLGNWRLRCELPLWYAAVAARLLRGSTRPQILIDWTEITRTCWSLTAAVPVAGRAIPIYSEVHPPSGNGNRRQLRRFVRVLRSLVPEEIRPTLIVDAGFMGPFYEACLEFRFDLIVRLQNHGRLRAWIPDRTTTVGVIAAQARRVAKCHGQWAVYDANRRGTTLRVVSAKRTGLLRRSDDSSYRKRAVEPWVLATTRQDLTPDEVVSLYALRMRIEEMFRDAKNPRFGWSLAHTGTRSAERLEVLLLITTLAMLAVILVGAAADEAGCTRFLQANTTRRRAVLSLFRIGCLTLAELAQRRRIAR